MLAHSSCSPARAVCTSRGAHRAMLADEQRGPQPLSRGRPAAELRSRLRTPLGVDTGRWGLVYCRNQGGPVVALRELWARRFLVGVRHAGSGQQSPRQDGESALLVPAAGGGDREDRTGSAGERADPRSGSTPD